jgi:hypothetical protein
LLHDFIFPLPYLSAKFVARNLVDHQIARRPLRQRESRARVLQRKPKASSCTGESRSPRSAASALRLLKRFARLCAQGPRNRVTNRAKPTTPSIRCSPPQADYLHDGRSSWKCFSCDQLKAPVQQTEPTIIAVHNRSNRYYRNQYETTDPLTVFHDPCHSPLQHSLLRNRTEKRWGEDTTRTGFDKKPRRIEFELIRPV